MNCSAIHLSLVPRRATSISEQVELCDKLVANVLEANLQIEFDDLPFVMLQGFEHTIYLVYTEPKITHYTSKANP